MIYFIRHGLDDERYVGGHSDVPLLLDGIKQIQDTAKYIETMLPPISKIYSSNIFRAIQSSEIIAQTLKTEIVLDNHLREQDKGDINGLLLDEAQKLFPLHFENIGISDRYPNGESYMDMYSRLIPLFKEMPFDDNSIIVTHRGVINSLYFYLNDIKPNMNKKQFSVTHGSIHEFNPEKKLIKKIY